MKAQFQGTGLAPNKRQAAGVLADVDDDEDFGSFVADTLDGCVHVLFQRTWSSSLLIGSTTPPGTSLPPVRLLHGNNVYTSCTKPTNATCVHKACKHACRPGGAPMASQGTSFSFHGNSAASANTPKLPGACYNGAAAGGAYSEDGQQDPGGHEVEGPVVLCHCGLPCTKLEAKTDLNAGR